MKSVHTAIATALLTTLGFAAVAQTPAAAPGAAPAAREGRGLTRVLSYQVDAELRSGKLKRVLASYEPPPVPIHVLHASGKRVPARVRAFVDLAVAHFKALPLR